MKKFEEYHLGSEAKIASAGVPGPKSREMLALQEAIEGSIVSYPRSMPIAIERAKGAIVEDIDNNRFIDFFSGCGVLNLGHCNQDILAYAREQQEKLVHALDFPTENKMKLIRKILAQFDETVRDQYKVAFCGPTGADAVEAAIKLAKHYTGRSSIIAFQGSYHGMSSGALAATSNVGFRQKITSLMPNVHFIPYSYCYRCAFRRRPENCGLDCADYFEDILKNPHSGIPKPAAVLLEPVQGEGGTIVPKDGFLERIIEIARHYGVVTIYDEIQSGFFRTGKFLATQHTGAAADIYTLSKGLGGVGFPIAALVYNKRVESWGPGDHVGTFRANQVSIAAANGAFDFVSRNDVETHVDQMSNLLMEKLRAIQTESLYIGEVRGRGLFIGVEFVKNRATREPFPEYVKQFRKLCFEKGLLFEVGGHYKNVVRIIPPLIINEAIVNNAMAIFRQVLEECDASTLVESAIRTSTSPALDETVGVK